MTDVCETSVCACVECVYSYAKDIDDYCEMLLRRGRKPATINQYRSVIKIVCAKIEKLGRCADPRKLTEDDVYYALESMNIIGSTKTSYAQIINKWCIFFDNRRAKASILDNKDRPNVKWVSNKEVAAMMEGARPSDKMIIYLGSAYGLRRGEISALKIDDIKKGYMVVHGKGHGPDGKTRKVPLIGDTDPAIDEYIRYRKEMIKRYEDLSEGHFIIMIYAGACRGCIPEYIGDRCKTVMESNGIDASSHALRRNFITSAYQSNNDIVDIMKIVGHTDPAITARYIQTDNDRLRNVIKNRNQYIS